MKIPHTISRPAQGFTVFSAAVAAAGLAAPHLLPVDRRRDGELESLRAERERLSTNDDATLARLRRDAAEVPHEQANPESLAALLDPAVWHVERSTADRTLLAARAIDPDRAWQDMTRVFGQIPAGGAIAQLDCSVSADGGWKSQDECHDAEPTLAAVRGKTTTERTSL
jgi:hypothetical protein